ncbi:MAG TPA: hypothetical protein VGN47_01525 [Blastococcus sp.]|jgi:hypothetical protein|nr:hypothetical protein [Blastococcus sp.]
MTLASSPASPKDRFATSPYGSGKKWKYCHGAVVPPQPRPAEVRDQAAADGIG